MIKRFLFITFTLFFSFICFATGISKPFVVVLDAGHGGHDPGNRGNGLYEKDIALDIILKTGEILERTPGIKVVYTRKTDKFVDLFVRGRIANQANADLFVSVHCNAHNTQAFGAETFVLGVHANQRNFNIAKKENSVILLEDNYAKNYDGFDPNSPESVIGLTITQEEYLEQSLSLASYVQNNFSKQLNRKNRGVKQAGFIVLHQTFMPSVLIETGFLTNNSEGKYLNSNRGKQQMADAISKAILDYKKSVQQSYSTEEYTESIDVKTKPVRITEKPIAKATSTIVKKETPITTTTTVNNSNVIYRVQLAASRVRIEPKPSNFKGVQTIEMFKIDQYYKYYFGNTFEYQTAKTLRREALNKGFKGCFIVPFRNGVPIKLSEALKR